MKHSILIIGQSNMAGRGFINEVEPISNKNIFVMRNGRWWPLYVPVNPDRVTSGINLCETFADSYSKDREVEVGIIPCADGGTCLDQWAVGDVLFDHACYMSELALRSSEIVAVLWHQGESDCTDDLWPQYENKLSVIFDAFREKLGLGDVPFLVGGLGDFLKYFQGKDIAENYVRVNEALQNYAAKTPMTGFVSAEGLGANPDNLHFSAKALREFGLRYYEEFKKIEKKDRVTVSDGKIKESVIREIEYL